MIPVSPSPEATSGQRGQATTSEVPSRVSREAPGAQCPPAVALVRTKVLTDAQIKPRGMLSTHPRSE